MKVPFGFDQFPINRANSYKVNPTETHSSSDIDVDLGIDINSGFIVPNMPQNFQPYYNSMFNSIDDSIDRAQNLDMKVPSGFDPIPIYRTNLAQDIRVKTQLNEMPQKLSSNVTFPQSICETFTQSPYSETKNSGDIYQSGHDNFLPFFSDIGLSGPKWVSNDSFQLLVNATHKSVDVTYDFKISKV